MARDFNELRAKMSPERRARVEAQVQKTLAAMARKELRRGQNSTTPPSSNNSESIENTPTPRWANEFE